MPELPDVENYRRHLEQTSLNREIAGVHVGDGRVLAGVSADGLHRRLRGRRFTGARRHGKHLLVSVDDGGWLVLHFGMTGRLHWFEPDGDDPKHDRVRFDFADGSHLAYVNQRLFGHVGLADDADAFIKGEDLGPDALDDAVDARTFAAALRGKRTSVKAALTDQSVLAGIGNVYADEILFQAGVHPKAPVRGLDEPTVHRLHGAMRRVLQTAIERGAGSEDLADRLPGQYLLRARGAGEACPRCGGEVRKEKISGRTGYYCPRCQTAGAPG
jgi:formamidopyrimidine-DNA glycosylase